MVSGNEVRGRDKNDTGIMKTMTETERLIGGAFIGAVILYMLTSNLNSFLGVTYPAIFYLGIGAVVGAILVKFANI
ncbi:TPA: hypothetical protein HA243_06005 [Candidatus Micrarchaeota archaeon]|nr:hypothetical protein [Candidatus Micrarchaeota archaeon]